MQQFQQEYPLSIKDSDQDFRGAQSWADVFEAARLATEAYLQRGQGSRNILRSWGRKIGDQNGTIQPILQAMLPSGDYGSLACGG